MRLEFSCFLRRAPGLDVAISLEETKILRGNDKCTEGSIHERQFEGLCNRFSRIHRNNHHLHNRLHSALFVGVRAAEKRAILVVFCY